MGQERAEVLGARERGLRWLWRRRLRRGPQTAWVGWRREQGWRRAERKGWGAAVTGRVVGRRR